MIELAKYLRACNINAMIDMLDVTDTTDQVSIQKNGMRVVDEAWTNSLISRLWCRV